MFWDTFTPIKPQQHNKTTFKYQEKLNLITLLIHGKKINLNFIRTVKIEMKINPRLGKPEIGCDALIAALVSATQH